MNRKIDLKIRECVAAYRRANDNIKLVKFTSPAWDRACHMMMDRASGALDVLYELSPDSPAWADTKWIF